VLGTSWSSTSRSRSARHIRRAPPCDSARSHSSPSIGRGSYARCWRHAKPDRWRAAAFESDPRTKMARTTSINDNATVSSTTPSHHRTLLHKVTRRRMVSYSRPHDEHVCERRTVAPSRTNERGDIAPPLSGYPTRVTDADRGREGFAPSPPSEPCVRFSRTRLSSRWFPHRERLACS